MLVKTITIILYVGIITQIFALSDSSLEFLQMLSINPMIIFCAAPFIIGAGIIIAIKILIHGTKLIFDCFVVKQETWETKLVREMRERGELL